MEWHIAQAEPQKDQLACAHLKRRRYEFYYPVFPVQRAFRGRIVPVHIPLFRNYIFVKKGANQDWYLLETAPGIRVVQSLLPVNGRYATISEEEMTRVRDKAKELSEQAVEQVKTPQLKPGDKVRVAVGLCAEMLLDIEALDNDGRVARLKGYLFNSQVSFTAPTDHLTAA